jgi:NADH dehydrogenase
MATIGRNEAVAELGSLQLGGFVAWVVWLFIHLLYVLGFRNRLAVAIQWRCNTLPSTAGRD